MVFHWACASALCANNWRKKGLKYYRLPLDSELRSKYSTILKNANINWSKQVICSAHWSGGVRRSLEHLPDIICPDDQMKKLSKSLQTKLPIARAKEIKRKIRCVETYSHIHSSNVSSTLAVRKRKEPLDRSNIVPVTKKRKKSIQGYIKESRLLQKELENLRSENTLLKKQLIETKQLTKVLQDKCQSTEEKFKKLHFDQMKGKFDYTNLKNNGKEFYYMCGLLVKEFDCLYDCLYPFLSLLIYPDCVETEKKKNTNNKLLDEKTELLVALTIARHAIDLGVVAKLVGGSASTMSRIFVAWMTLIRSVFESINLKPFPGFLEKKMPKKFSDAGFGDCALLGDNTETWISQSENFELNNVTFSHYKNHTTGKVSIWIFPHGGLCLCSDAYPGTISDEKLTEEIGVLNLCPQGKTVMTDKGFAISELCHEKGINHNRPPMKFETQYSENDISLNFDIATLRIYNENAIGRISSLRFWRFVIGRPSRA